VLSSTRRAARPAFVGSVLALCLFLAASAQADTGYFEPGAMECNSGIRTTSDPPNIGHIRVYGPNMSPTDPWSASGQHVAWLPRLMRYTGSGWRVEGPDPGWMWNWSVGYSSAIYDRWRRFDRPGYVGMVDWSNLAPGYYAVYNELYWYPTGRVPSSRNAAYSPVSPVLSNPVYFCAVS
jgi:hypothetical protein